MRGLEGQRFETRAAFVACRSGIGLAGLAGIAAVEQRAAVGSLGRTAVVGAAVVGEQELG